MNKPSWPGNYRVHPGVLLDPSATLGEFVILGEHPNGKRELPTEIGPGAVIRSHTVIYHGNRIGQNFQTGHHVMVRESNVIGDDVSIGTGTVLEHHVTVGDRVRLHSQVFVPEYCVLEDEAWLGPNVVLTNARYPASPGAKKNLQGVTIRHQARIGANSTLLPGVVIGEQALVGAGSIVVIDVEPGTVVAGNPARVINRVSNLPY